MNLPLRRPAFVAAAFGLACLGPVPAHADFAATANANQAAAAHPALPETRVTRLIGSDVRNPAGERVGDLDDLVIDIQSGKVRYGVLAFGGFMGLGERRFAFPLRRFKSGSRGQMLELDVDPDLLRRAPGFDAYRWPDWNSGYYETVDQFFGEDHVTRYGRRLWRASDLVGAEVKDGAGNDVGHLVDVTVDLRSGAVDRAVLEIDRLATLPDRRVAIPVKRLRTPLDGNGLVLDMSPEEVQRLATAHDPLRNQPVR